MPRRRVYKPSTAPRYLYKMARLYIEGKTGLMLEAGTHLVQAMSSEWNSRFGDIRSAWEDFKKQYKVPPFLRGIVRSALLFVLRQLKAGVSPEESINIMIGKGLPREWADNILAYVRGLTPPE